MTTTTHTGERPMKTRWLIIRPNAMTISGDAPTRWAALNAVARYAQAWREEEGLHNGSPVFLSTGDGTLEQITIGAALRQV